MPSRTNFRKSWNNARRRGYRPVYHRRRAAMRIQRAFRRRRGLRSQFKKVKKIVYQDIEHRWIDDMSFTFQIPGAGGDIIPLGLETIVQGDNVTNRTGNKITLKGLHLKGQVFVADSHNFIRLMLVMVNTLQQIVIPSDILQPDATTNNPTIYSPYKKESKIKFRVLLDKMYKMQQQAAGSVYPEIINVDLSYKWPKGKTITYNLPTATAPIYWFPVVLVLSDSQIVTHPQFRGSKRLTFIA